MRPKTTFALPLLLVAFLVGCTPPAAKPNPTPEPEPVSIPQEFANRDALKPGASPPREANLILNGTEIPVVLKEKRDSNFIVYSWIVDPAGESGEPVEVESEKYFDTTDLFSFAATAQEKYDPPISLIQYPMTVGKGWEWAGEVITGKSKAKAKASVSSKSDTLNLSTGKVSALMVVVELAYDGISSPNKRELKFWFEPGKGLIRRELWASSTRTPRTSADTTREKEGQ